MNTDAEWTVFRRKNTCDAVVTVVSDAAGSAGVLDVDGRASLQDGTADSVGERSPIQRLHKRERRHHRHGTSEERPDSKRWWTNRTQVSSVSNDVMFRLYNYDDGYNNDNNNHNNNNNNSNNNNYNK